MLNKSKYLILLGITLSGAILLLAIKSIFQSTLQVKPNEHTLPENIYFDGERVVQLGKHDDFIISEHLKAFNDKGTEVPLIIVGSYDMSQPGVYFLKIKTDSNEEESVSTNFTLIVFSEEEFIY